MISNMVKIDKDLVIAIVIAVGMWSLIAALTYFIIIPSLLTAIAHPDYTNESLTTTILKISLIVIPATTIYYLVMKKALYRSAA
jgi:uncharacterized protein YqhQ